MPPSKFRIRSAKPADTPALLALIRELAAYERLSHRVTATEQSLRNALFGRKAFAEALLGTVDGKPVAYAVLHHTFSTFVAAPRLYLEDIYVQEAYRGRGFGKMMLRQVCRIAVQRGCKTLAWAVLDWNEPALRFYRRVGAEPVTEWVAYQLSGEALHKLASAGEGRDKSPRHKKRAVATR